MHGEGQFGDPIGDDAGDDPLSGDGPRASNSFPRATPAAVAPAGPNLRRTVDTPAFVAMSQTRCDAREARPKQRRFAVGVLDLFGGEVTGRIAERRRRETVRNGSAARAGGDRSPRFVLRAPATLRGIGSAHCMWGVTRRSPGDVPAVGMRRRSIRQHRTDVRRVHRQQHG